MAVRVFKVMSLYFPPFFPALPLFSRERKKAASRLRTPPVHFGETVACLGLGETGHHTVFLLSLPLPR